MSEVRIDRNGLVAVVTLDAPRRRNALTVAMADELIAACDELDHEHEVGAVVVTGNGDAFCAGADLEVLADVGRDIFDETAYAGLDRIYEAFLRVSELRAPTVAAVRGSAVGAGLNLALATDLRIVASDARLLAGFLRIGVHPGGGSLTMLTARAGHEAAAALALFGAEIDGRRAVEIGLAWQAVPAEAVLDTAIALAVRAAGDPALARLAVQSLRAEAKAQMPLRVAVEYERASQLWSLARRARDATSTAED
jgi:enoyl-CoA hydratase